ncbi:MAG: DUF86 domain-containing protein [Deltaproteobacteria bacterium]|nr:DUF86 domain-containing protein [Deltaproteobacteria bacterium]
MTLYGNSIEVLRENHILRDAMGMKLQQISELSQHLSDNFTRSYGNIPWRTIKGLRVVFAHRYQKLNYETMFDTLSDDIPGLKRFCVDILALAERQIHDSPNDGSSGGPRMG